MCECWDFLFCFSFLFQIKDFTLHTNCICTRKNVQNIYFPNHKDHLAFYSSNVSSHVLVYCDFGFEANLIELQYGHVCICSLVNYSRSLVYCQYANVFISMYHRVWLVFVTKLLLNGQLLLVSEPLFTTCRKWTTLRMILVEIRILRGN